MWQCKETIKEINISRIYTKMPLRNWKLNCLCIISNTTSLILGQRERTTVETEGREDGAAKAAPGGKSASSIGKS